ncbi:MAG: RNA methyltransferase, partial [Cyanobacteria bacterium K_DeepCast_150m_m2_101]|nr:RNA methyltransferase [Cyanobacteria bacterium K_DeepCast_150m_m2_101]
MSLPEQLLLSDLLRRHVRCDQGIDHGAGAMAWMHPPVHRLLGWISKPSAFGDRRQAWRLDQLRGLSELEALVKGPGADTDLPTVDRLPTLIEAVLLDR